MSIVVGKRNFAESFSNMAISDYSQNGLYRSKMVMTENALSNKNMTFQINQSYMLENAKILKQHFQQVEDKEIMTVLEDCDNNLDIAMEILQKSGQPKPSFLIPLPTEERTVRRINTSKDASQREENNSRKREERKQEENPQEEPNPTLSRENIGILSTHIIEKLKTLNSMDEAKELVAHVLFEVINEAEKKDKPMLRKLKDDKAILVKAFLKQRQKTQAYEEKNEELKTMLNNHEQEIVKLKTINYKLELRLKSLDMNQEETRNFDVY